MKTCEVCGTHFTDRPGKRKQTCSRRCGAFLWRGIKPVTKCCPTCKTEFTVGRKAEKQVYCCKKCARHAYGSAKRGKFERFPVTCRVCAKIFHVVKSELPFRKTCSRKCAGTARLVPLAPRSCLWCATLFSPRRENNHCCSMKCARRHWGSKVRAANAAAGRENPRTSKQRLLERAKKKCQICGWGKVPEVLERHHCDRNHRNNSDNNLLLLCPTCHSVDHYNARDGQYAVTKRNRER